MSHDQLVLWGACVVLGGMCGFFSGVHVFFRGVCMVFSGGHAWGFFGGHAWFFWGACVVFWGGMHGFFQGACMVFWRGVHGFFSGRACMVFFSGGGMHGLYNEIWSMSGRYASYWNAFLLFNVYKMSWPHVHDILNRGLLQRQNLFNSSIQ